MLPNNTGGTMRSLRLLGAVAAAVGAAAQTPALEDDGVDSTTTTTTSTTTITVTTSAAYTVTSTTGASDASVGSTSLESTTSSETLGPAITSLGPTASLAPTEMTSEDKKFVLQGCFAQDGTQDIGLLLGQNYTTPAASDMSLSLCLKLCASAVAGVSNAAYPYVGVADGNSCYCGTGLNTTAPQYSINDCTLPCAGSDSEACGGHGYMSVYKLISSDTAFPSTSAGNSASLHAAAQTEIANTHGSGATFQEDKDTDMSGAKSPGTIAGIAVGSVSGVGLLLFLVFVVTKWQIRRRQLHAAGAASPHKEKSCIAACHSRAGVETNSATVDSHDGASILDAVRVDLRRLDGVVMDQHSPSPRSDFAGANETQIGTAATTGAEWKNQNKGASPLTPRTPRHMDVLEEEIQQQPSTPSIVVHPPASVAPNYGLGERAWHRRRLSMPYPPLPDVVAGAATVDDRRALPSQASRRPSAGNGADVRTLRQGDETVSALSEEEGMVESPSWQWTLSTASGNENTKTGKQA